MHLTAMDTPRSTAMTRTCGTLTLSVRHDGVAHAGQFGLRHQWAYRIQDTTRPDRSSAEGVDLYPARRSPADAREALASLVIVLTAAGQAYSSATQTLTAGSVSLARFADWVFEAAHRNVTELTALALELEPTKDQPADAAARVQTLPTDQALWPPGQWYDVVFLQDEEGYRVVDLIDARGPEAAIEHLSGWDYGAETREAAAFHDHTHTELPTEPGGHSMQSQPYALVWHTGLGHVTLLRQFEPDHEPPIWWLERAGMLLPPEAPASTDPAPPAGPMPGKPASPSL